MSSSSPLEKWREGFELITQNQYSVNVDERVERKDEYGHCQCRQHYEYDDDMPQTCLDVSCFNFVARTECVKCPSSKCGNHRFQRLQFKQVEVRETPNKGHGLFTLEAIAKNELIIEYVGEVIDVEEMEDRQAQRHDSNKHLYMMEMKKNVYIDSRFKGGVARFLNHSCDPNSVLDKWIVRNRFRLGVFAIRDIVAGEEITFDYHWFPSLQRAPTKCYCGTSQCRGYLEFFKNEDEKFLYVRSGLWVNRTDSLSLRELYISNSNGTQLDPQKIKGKFLKVQRQPDSLDEEDSENEDTNERRRRRTYYDECKVESYLEDEDRFVCLDLKTREMSKEDLHDTELKWYWLDQNSENIVQRRVSQYNLNPSITVLHN